MCIPLNESSQAIKSGWSLFLHCGNKASQSWYSCKSLSLRCGNKANQSWYSCESLFLHWGNDFKKKDSSFRQVLHNHIQAYIQNLHNPKVQKDRNKKKKEKKDTVTPNPRCQALRHPLKNQLHLSCSSILCFSTVLRVSASSSSLKFSMMTSLILCKKSVLCNTFLFAISDSFCPEGFLCCRIITCGHCLFITNR